MTSSATSGARLLAACVALALARPAPSRAGEAPPGEASFAGTWSATGRRQQIGVEGGGTAAIADVSGAVVLATGEGLSRGFRGRAIGFDDGRGRSVGRCVWTDENGDHLFSTLEGEALATGRRFRGAITGGTGRYAGLEGEYSFTWQYVVPGEDGAIQGRAADLAGRVRRGGPSR